MEEIQPPFPPDAEKPSDEAQLYENQPFVPLRPAPQVIVVLGAFAIFSLLGTAVGSGLTMLLGSWQGLDAASLASSIGSDAAPSERIFVRWMLAFSHFGTFLLPGLLTAMLFFRGQNPLADSPLASALAYLKAARRPKWSAVGWGALLLLAALPLVHYLYGVNKMLPLPEWMRDMEEQTNAAIKGILRMDSLGELAANLFVMAIVPAIGEELVFRGILQQQLMRRIASPMVAILVSAAIFSAIHLQFEGFLPRWLLGALLGWLFWRSQNFWIPVAAHFLNNAAQVVGAFLFQKELSSFDMEQDIEVPALAVVLALAWTWMIGRRIHENTEHPAT